MSESIPLQDHTANDTMNAWSGDIYSAFWAAKSASDESNFSVCL